MTTNAVSQAVSRPIGIKLAAALAGALVVAGAAQVSIPIPGSPVPFTLQPMAVLIVGGLLGARYGALSLAMYLAMGAAGLPVFAPFGAPGMARLLGPTGGFLLSYPLAAAVTGWAVGRTGGRAVGKADAVVSDRPTARPPFFACVLAALAGMVLIFAGGLAQLSVLGLPLALGITPFAAADLVKVMVAALIIQRFNSTTRALR